MNTMKIREMVLLTVAAFSMCGGLSASLDTLLSDDAYQDYHGWLKYLDILQEQSIERYGSTSEEAEGAEARVNEWVARIEGNIHTLSEMRGAFEWAYESDADDTGQPFTVSIPESYDPNRSYELVVDLHGSGGDHIRDADWMTEDEGNIALAPFGRASSGGYRDLSGVDVLDAIAYVKAHWNIDDRAVHIQGISMGGHGTFDLSNRYPQLFASASPEAGAGIHLPVENWEHLPMYSSHSLDDTVVPIVLSRLPMQALESINDNVVIEEVNGYGHSIWEYLSESGDKPAQWSKGLRTPPLNEIYRIDYTATDGIARRGYWAEIEEWGPESAPARFRIEADHDNGLQVNLENVDQLKVDLNHGPFDLQMGLSITVNGSSQQTLSAPLPEELYIVHDGENYTCTAVAPSAPEYRLHYPGGGRNLYGGEPLLIVWGTQGDDHADEILEAAALAMRRCPHPYMNSNEGIDSKGYVGYESRYGLLHGKPDFEVTEEDMQRYNLVILGSASENSVAAQIAPQLPVRSVYSWIVADDGVWWNTESPTIFFCHYNPLAPQKLIYWISSASLDFYESGHYLSEWVAPAFFMTGGTTIFGGRDFVIYDWHTNSLVASRNFDSRWNWEASYKNSPRIPFEDVSYRGVAEMEGALACTMAGTDFAIISWYEYGISERVVPGRTRLMDLMPDLYGRKIAIIELTGEQLLDYKRACDAIQSGWGRFDIIGNQSVSSVVSGNTYTVCLDPNVFRGLISEIGSLPESIYYSDISMQEALKAYIQSLQ